MRSLRLLASVVFGVANLVAAPASARPIEHPGLLLPPASQPYDQFGSSIARAGDQLLVGAPSTDIGPTLDAGSVYVLTRQGAGWTPVGQVSAAQPVERAGFGGSIAVDGASAAIGTYASSRLAGQSVSIYALGAGLPQHVETIDSPAGELGFGRAVALSSDRLAVSSFAGAQARVHVYERVAGRYQRVSTLTFAADSSGFGAGLAFDGDALLVGAIDAPRGNESGVVAVYRRAAAGWELRNQFFPTDTGALGPIPNFGGRIATSGGAALVASIDAMQGDLTQQGAAFVFVRSGDTYVQQGRAMVAADRDAQRGFGFGIAIEGDIAVVGAPFGDGGTFRGHAFAYSRRGDRWVLRSVLAVTGSETDGLGTAAAIAGDVAVVGVPVRASFFGTPGVGAIDSWRRNPVDDTWAQVDSYQRPDGPTWDEFGASIVTSGDTALIAAPLQERGSVDAAGRVHVYRRRPSGWVHEAELVGSDVPKRDDRFGHSIALAGDVAVVGAAQADTAEADAGLAYVFRRTANGWVREAELAATDGQAFDNFGISVAIDRDDPDSIIVGASRGDSSTVFNCGSAYIYRLIGGVWQHQARLLPSQPEAFEYFGWSVALGGGRAFVGVPDDDVDGIVDAGSVRVFPLLGAAGAEVGVLKPGPTPAGTQFGKALAIDRDGAATRLYIGAPMADSAVGARTGVVYRAEWRGAAPTLVKLTAPATVRSGDHYGEALAAFDGEFLVGAPLTDDGVVTDRGAAYHFDRDDLLGTKLLAIGGNADTRSFGRAVALGPRGDGASRHEPLVGLFVNGPMGLGLGRVDAFEVQPLLSDGFEDAPASSTVAH